MDALSAIVTVAAVVMGNFLSSAFSGRAKVWELRRQAYGVILSELASVERLCDVADEWLAQDAYGYFESDARDRHDTQMSEHMTTARQRFSDDYLILSDQFIACFAALDAELEGIPPDEAFPVDQQSFGAAIRRHRPLLLAQARGEMAGQGRAFGLSTAPLSRAYRWLSEVIADYLGRTKGPPR